MRVELMVANCGRPRAQLSELPSATRELSAAELRGLASRLFDAAERMDHWAKVLGTVRESSNPWSPRCTPETEESQR